MCDACTEFLHHAMRRNRSARKACQPICALNPYSNDWTIRAKVASKGPLRHYDKNGQTHSVGSLDVVDDQVLSWPFCGLTNPKFFIYCIQLGLKTRRSH